MYKFSEFQYIRFQRLFLWLESIHKTLVILCEVAIFLDDFISGNKYKHFNAT